jgi:penicillin-binding protein 1A
VWLRLKAQSYNSSRVVKQKDKIKGVETPDPSLYAQFELEQEPLVEAATLTLDHHKQDVMSMVGGFNFKRSQFNRVLQAHRQTGSSYKTFIYAAALDYGYHPSTLLLDAPIVYENQGKKFEDEWKPTNHSRSYDGEVTVRNALIRSLNVPAVKVIEDIGVPFAIDYSRRLGIFSRLNEDFTLALGSSSLTIYEMTKAFAVFAKLGKSINPRVITEVKDRNGNVVLSNLTLDQWFGETLEAQKKQFEERRIAFLEKQEAEEAVKKAGEGSLEEVLVTEKDMNQKQKRPSIEPFIFFKDPEQLISPQTAYLMTSILSGVIRDPNGTAARVSGELTFDVAGKTGSTNDYIDGWFVGYSPLYTTGVWVGFDQERTLGPSEVGGRTALPIWTDIMKSLHAEYKESGDQLKFQVPENIEFVDVDYETGEKAKPGSRRVISQAFRLEDVKKLEEAQVREENVESTKEDLDE